MRGGYFNFISLQEKGVAVVCSPESCSNVYFNLRKSGIENFSAHRRELGRYMQNFAKVRKIKNIGIGNFGISFYGKAGYHF